MEIRSLGRTGLKVTNLCLGTMTFGNQADKKTSFGRRTNRSHYPTCFLPVIEKMYEGAIEAESIARAIAFAIEQPSDVAINEMIIRPTHQER